MLRWVAAYTACPTASGRPLHTERRGEERRGEGRGGEERRGEGRGGEERGGEERRGEGRGGEGRRGEERREEKRKRLHIMYSVNNLKFLVWINSTPLVTHAHCLRTTVPRSKLD